MFIGPFWLLGGWIFSILLFYEARIVIYVFLLSLLFDK